MVPHSFPRAWSQYLPVAPRESVLRVKSEGGGFTFFHGEDLVAGTQAVLGPPPAYNSQHQKK